MSYFLTVALNVIILDVVMLNVIILDVVMQALYHHADCYYAEGVVMLNVIILDVVMLNVICSASHAECYYAGCRYAELLC